MQLTGRVSWDQEWNGTCFFIPSKKDWQILFVSAWLAFWLIGPFRMELKAIRSLSHPASADWFNLLWGVGWIFGIVFAVSYIVWSIGGGEVLRLTPSELELTATVFGIVIRRRLSPVEEVRNLRFVPAWSQRRRRHESSICYEDQKGTVKLGSRLSDAEALAIIEQMLIVYPFPKRDKAMEYIDLSGQ